MALAYLVGCALFPHPPIMLPEVGGAECLHVNDTITAAETAARFLLERNPTTIVIMTPHGPAFRDAVGVNVSPVLKGNLSEFGAAEVSVSFETNSLLVQNIIKQSNRLGVSLQPLDAELSQQYRFSLQLDHGAVIPLSYLYKAGFRGQVVHMSSGFLSYPEMYACGKAVQAAAEATRQKVSIVASGDLSHRLKPGAPAGYDPAGKKFDAQVVEALQSMDIRAMFNLSEELVEAAGECGLRPIFFLLGAMDGLETTSEILSYEGPFGVGYAVATFAVKKAKTKEVSI